MTLLTRSAAALFLFLLWPALGCATDKVWPPDVFPEHPGQVQAVDQNTPPVSPAAGQAWLVGASPTGAFVGHTNQIAVWRGDHWDFYKPGDGWLVFNLGTALEFRYNGTAWAALGVGSTSSVTAASITDSTSAGRALLTAADAAAQRIALGLGTTANPQFATIELGAASDTTFARLSAGDVGVEGNRIFRAGGADVPVADGGTGASTLTGVLKGNGTSAFSAATACTDYASIGCTNTFTSAQKVRTSGISENASVESTESSANYGPDLSLWRDNATNANQGLGSLNFRGNNSTPAKVLYGAVRAQVLDSTATSEDAIIHIYTQNAGTNASRVDIGQGMVVGPSATGGDQGSGTVNVDTGYFVDGANLTAIYQPLDSDLTAWAAVNPSSYLSTSGIAAAYQPLDGDLTALAALTTPATTITNLASTYQPLNSALTGIALGFRGALVHKETAATGVNFTSNIAVTWDGASDGVTEEYDTDGAHSASTNPSRLTIPASWPTHVRVCTDLLLASGTAGEYAQVTIRKDGSATIGAINVTWTQLFSTTQNHARMGGCSPRLTVVPGTTYFETYLAVQADTTVDVSAASWMSIEPVY